MLGEQIGTTQGRRIVRRVISSDPLKVEVTFEDSGSILGVSTTGFGTYVSQVRPDAFVYGEGEGAMLTGDGEVISWKGSGLGQIKAGGALSYRGILYFRTASAKLAALNSAPGVFEYEVAPDGTTESKVWAWK